MKLLYLLLLLCVLIYTRKFEAVGEQFLKDGEPFTIMGGSFHYFRIHPDYWEITILKLKAMGLNTISTYVPWNLHEPERGQYNFNGFGDIVRFLELCKKHNMYVLLRPGPYICGEWEFGGIPYWILEDQLIKIRTNDPLWTNEISEWYSVLMPIVSPYFYSNDGTIIFVQIENEYGSYPSCDHIYMSWLYNETIKYTGNDIIIYTTDIGNDGYLQCGVTPNAYAAVDFGPGDCTDPFNAQRNYQKIGPNMNTEYYPGWLSHWGEKFPHRDIDPIINTMKQMLDRGASFNFYVAIGGTNYGFYNGANGGGNDIQVDTTSYDYDAPLTESGDITNKYIAIREVLQTYYKDPLPDIPNNNTKKNYGIIKFNKSSKLFNNLLNQVRYSIDYNDTLYFEQLHIGYGYVIYITNIIGKHDKIINIGYIHDYVMIFINYIYIGSISKSEQGKDYHIGNVEGELILLVENQGRINYDYDMTDRKGIKDIKITDIYINKWKMKTLPMDNTIGIKWDNILYNNGPTFYYSSFNINNINDICDTYIDVRGWNKGHIYINGFNIGKYWEPGPPQHTLYIPAPLLKLGNNEIIVFEQSKPNDDYTMELIDHPIIEY